jgi:hypothetical protein
MAKQARWVANIQRCRWLRKRDVWLLAKLERYWWLSKGDGAKQGGWVAKLERYWWLRKRGVHCSVQLS